MVARVDPQKDHATFIRAATQVLEVMPAVRFVLVGTAVTTDAEIRRVLQETGLAHRFTLQERTGDIPDVMSALDVFCLVSRSEGFPNVLGEAMACAVPSISTDVGDARDILRDARLVVDVEDPRMLADSILGVLRLAPAERRALGEELRQRIADRFDIETVWSTYRNLYDSVLRL
jgi:glycosyltransferase involved in cell wall biosynthesis